MNPPNCPRCTLTMTVREGKGIVGVQRWAECTSCGKKSPNYPADEFTLDTACEWAKKERDMILERNL